MNVRRMLAEMGLGLGKVQKKAKRLAPKNEAIPEAQGNIQVRMTRNYFFIFYLFIFYTSSITGNIIYFNCLCVDRILICPSPPSATTKTKKTQHIRKKIKN